MIGGSIATGDAGTAQLAARYAGAYRVVYRLVGDAVVADVLARDALVHAGAIVGRFRRRSPDARACLHAAALGLQDELWLGRARGPAGGTGFGEIPHRDERRRLRMAVRSLLGRQRAVFVLGELAGWSPDAVAAELRLSPDAHRRTSARALQTVRNRCAIQELGDGAGAA